MKKIHYILLTTFVFIALFYHETIGLNLSLLGVFLAVSTVFKIPKKLKTKPFWFTFIFSIVSCFSFAWYGDAPSFFALFFSLLLLNFQTKNKRMSILLAIPVFVTNIITFLCRFFNFKGWIPERKTKGMGQKIISLVVVPLIFISVFVGVYSMGSTHFSDFFTHFEWDFDILTFLFLLALGFFIAFNYWNFSIERTFYKVNQFFSSEFKNTPKPIPTWSFMDLNAERMSGVVSLLALNVLTLFFVITFSYELFYEKVQNPENLSLETHERVNTVILSIVMAILLMLFYFKSVFNFDKKSKLLRILALSWIGINSLLIFSTGLKNTEYVIHFGLTYKRLGVYAFLILALLGLIFTMIKILKKKTNFYLFTQMTWSVYGLVLIIAVINWGGIVTQYNINKGFKHFNYLKTLNFNHQLLKENFPNEYGMHIDYEVESYKENKKSLLSKIGYYETVD